MQSSGFGGDAAWGNPDDFAGGLVQGVVGEALGVAHARFGCSLAVETLPVGGHDGG
jgi:hypothetical protein